MLISWHIIKWNIINFVYTYENVRCSQLSNATYVSPISYCTCYSTSGHGPRLRFAIFFLRRHTLTQRTCTFQTSPDRLANHSQIKIPDREKQPYSYSLRLNPHLPPPNNICLVLNLRPYASDHIPKNFHPQLTLL